jgi:hypothetical protein
VRTIHLAEILAAEKSTGGVAADAVAAAEASEAVR